MSSSDETNEDGDGRELLNAWFDGELTSAQREQLEQRLSRSPHFARAAARAARLHDALERELRPLARTPAPSPARVERGRWRWLAAAAALAVLIAVWNVATSSRASAAQSELARVVAARVDGDRTFALSVLADAPTRRAGEDRSQAPLDGARLHLRGPECYVLVRVDERGQRTISGFDGAQSWSVAPRGPARVSDDPLRFRGALPGHQHGLPFVDPRDGLAELARSYDLELEREALLDGRRLARIDATRKPDVGRGPKRVEVWFDPDSARLVRLVLDRLPQAKSGPRAVAIDFVDDRTLPPDFFHVSHHAPGRALERDASR